MKSYRFRAVYNDNTLFEFNVAESSDFNTLAHNICGVLQVNFDDTGIVFYTKKKGRKWDDSSFLAEDGLSETLKSQAFKAGKKLFIKFSFETEQGIELHFIDKSNVDDDGFEVTTKVKKITKKQLGELALNPAKTTTKSKVKASAKPAIEETDEDIDDILDDEDDSMMETDMDFEDSDFGDDDEDDDDEIDDSGIFNADEIEDIDEDLDDALDIDDEEDGEYISDEDDFYPEDDEDYMDNYDSDDDDEDDDFYDRDDYDYEYYDEDDDDSMY